MSCRGIIGLLLTQSITTFHEWFIVHLEYVSSDATSWHVGNGQRFWPRYPQPVEFGPSTELFTAQSTGGCGPYHSTLSIHLKAIHTEERSTYWFGNRRYSDRREDATKIEGEALVETSDLGTTVCGQQDW